MNQSIYDEVTQAIIADLEKGVKPWVCPWEKNVPLLPQNLKTKSFYKGINILALWISTNKQGFISNQWVTFRQASEMNLKIKKGEHGTRCLYFKRYEKKLEVKEDKQGENSEKRKTPMITYSMPKMFNVFNINQLEGLDITEEPILENAIEKAEQIVQCSDAKIIYGRQAAFFRHDSDEIFMPTPQSFRTTDDYYATLLHEIIHWTGHQNRLNRINTWVFKQASVYAGEELVAELGSAFLCAALGIKGETQHASYIESWLKMFRYDKRAIFKAVSFAQQAIDYLMALNPSYDGSEETTNVNAIA